ncbi:MAG: dTMP kinase [Synergistaceae bacterium]|nr:dTMP kinase [Synergistaceae bacterium]
MNDKALFITLEGIDGSGKSTQVKNIAQWLENFTGRRTLCTFEPGGWDGGRTLREFILGSKDYNALSELLLFLADRSEHAAKVIIPALNSGNNIICERYNDSTLAYQSGGHKLNIEHVKSIIRACNFPEPDIKILLDITPELALERINSRKNINDKFESEGLALIKHAANFYRESCENFIVINCDKLSEHEVFNQIISRLEAEIKQCRSR